MSLTLQDSIDRFQQNEARVDEFINDPDNIGHFTTREGVQVPTVHALVQEVRASTAVLAQPDGAANVGYQPEEGEPTTVQAALRALEVGGAADPAGTAAQLLSEHLQAENPHSQYLTAQALAAHRLEPDAHPDYATKADVQQAVSRARLHAVALSF